MIRGVKPGAFVETQVPVFLFRDFKLSKLGDKMARRRNTGWENLEEKVERGPWSAFFTLGCMGFAMLCIVGVVLVGTGFIANPLTQVGRVVNKTIDADNMIYNYEWFKQQYQDIQAIDKKILESTIAVTKLENDLGDRKDWHRLDREEHARLASVELGLKQQRADLVATYNARSKMTNRSIFKTGDSELPETIE